MADINTLIITTSVEKANEKAEFYMHFGYVLQETRPGNDGLLVLVFQRRLDKNANQLAKYEKDYKRLDRKVPVGAIIWAILGFAFVVLYFALTKMENIKPYAGFGIPLFIICFAIAIFLLIIFFVVIFNKGKIQKRILLNCDRLQGIIKEVPLQEFIEPMGEQTGLIARNIDSIVPRNVR